MTWLILVNFYLLKID